MLGQALFNCILIYSWGLYAFLDRDLDENPSLPLYVATVAPAVLFMLFSIPSFARWRYQKITLVLVLLAALVAICSLARADFRTLLSLGSLCLMITALRNSGVAATPRLINFLFVLSIATCGVMHALVIGRYGIIPGQADDQTVPWRVSLFAFNVTPSWMLSLVVISLNYFYGRGVLIRALFILLALYFLVFSASRTALIILTLWIAFVVMTKMVSFRERLFYKLFIPCAVVMFVIALNGDWILQLMTGSNSPLVNTLLSKSAEGPVSMEEAGTSVERTILWSSHLDVFLENPLIGRGTFELEDLLPYTESHSVHGGESFITGLFARVGLLALLFVYFMHLVAVEATQNGDKLAYCLIIFVAISVLAYGTYMVPYDFMFLAIFGAMNYSRSATCARRRATADRAAHRPLGPLNSLSASPIPSR